MDIKYTSKQDFLKEIENVKATGVSFATRKTSNGLAGIGGRSSTTWGFTSLPITGNPENISNAGMKLLKP